MAANVTDSVEAKAKVIKIRIATGTPKIPFV